MGFRCHGLGFRLPDLEGLGLRDQGSGRMRVWGLGYLGVGVRRVNDYSGVTLNVARPDMNHYATLGVMLY